MGMKVATSFLQWSAQPIAHQSTSPSQSLPYGVSSYSSSIRRRCRRRDGGASLPCRFVPHTLDRSAIFGKAIHRSKSCEIGELSNTTALNVRPIRRACSASLDSFSDEEFSQKLLELALKFQVSDDEQDTKNTTVHSEPEIIISAMDNHDNHTVDIINNYGYLINGVDEANLALDSVEPPWQEMALPSSIERKASSVDLPLSLRIIKKKMQWEEGLKEARELACCSMKKAFSSMVFMIQELQSFTLQMRELLFYEDLQGILCRVQKEMHASFVWIFQQVFSQTPTLMVSVMILLANFTVYSMGANTALAAPPPTTTSGTELSFIFETQEHKKGEFDSSLIKTFSVSSSHGKTTSSGGNNGGGGGNTRPVAGGTDGKGFFDEANLFKTIVPDGGASHVSSSSPGSRTRTSEPSVSGREEEISLWNSMVEEAESMQLLTRDEALDHETKKRFVSPVEVNIEEDDHTDYHKTELLYQMELAREPNNPLLLVNYAQFLYLVTQDYDRAEECFKRAIEVEPRDAEAYNKYATFLWRVRNDICTAEEIFLEAISADPTNSYYSANYAHFLWNTGGEETCFPLSSPETPHEA